MNMSLEEYKTRSRHGEIYNSYWKESKGVVEETIKDNRDNCKITLKIPEGEDIQVIQEIIGMLVVSLKNIYNCKIEYDYTGTDMYILAVSWDDTTVVPYKNAIN